MTCMIDTHWRTSTGFSPGCNMCANEVNTEIRLAVEKYNMGDESRINYIADLLYAAHKTPLRIWTFIPPAILEIIKNLEETPCEL